MILNFHPRIEATKARLASRPHLPKPTDAALRLLREPSTSRRKNRICSADLLITMSIQSGFTGRYPLQLRKTGYGRRAEIACIGTTRGAITHWFAGRQQLTAEQILTVQEFL